MEKEIQKLKEETGFDEIVVGCFLSNYKQKHICPIATGGWCRDYVKCKCIEEGINRKIKEQQAHNEEAGKADKANPIKTVLLIALLVFLVMCIITMILALVRLLVYGVMEINYTRLAIKMVIYLIILLAIKLVIYLIISLLARM